MAKEEAKKADPVKVEVVPPQPPAKTEDQKKADELNEATKPPEGQEGVPQQETTPRPTLKQHKRTDKIARRMAKLGLTTAEPDQEQLEAKKSPNVGEIVHYVIETPTKRGEHRPMVVTAVDSLSRNSINGIVYLEPADLFGDTHMFKSQVPYGPEAQLATWHFPEEAVNDLKEKIAADEEDDKTDTEDDDE